MSFTRSTRDTEMIIIPTMYLNMILHLINDEKIVANTIASIEGVLPGQNTYIIFCSPNRQYYSKNLNTIEKNIILFKHPNDLLGLDFTKYEKVVISLFDEPKYQFVEKYIKHPVKIYWAIWGGDLYNEILLGRGYQLYSKNNSYAKAHRFKIFIKRLFLNRIRTIKYTKFIKGKVDYLLCVPCDAKLLNKYLGIKKRTLPSFAYAYDQILGKELLDTSVRYNSKNILCGNSASYTNNQEYVLEKINNIGLKAEYSVVMPLNYGGDENYISNIIKLGNVYFGEQYKPLCEFLPLNKYNQILLDATISVFGSWRQEAVGNIVILLYLGSKVYLSKRNPLLEHFRQYGFIIFTIEEADYSTFYQPIDEICKSNNRELVKKIFSHERKMNLIKSNYTI